MRQVFVLPADRHSPSGGNLYNRFLLEALRAAGVTLAVMTIDAAIRDARRGRPARYWLDTLLLDRMADFRTHLQEASECYVIVHFFPSLQPGGTSRDRKAFRRMEDAAFRSAHGFLLTSAFAAAQLASRSPGDKPFVVVPPAPAVLPGAKRRGPRAGFRALMVANLVPGKGVLEFLRAFGRRPFSSAAHSLEIAGRLDADPAYARRCLRVVETSAALRGSVRFLGALGPAALKRAYERNTIFISASHMETFGMALAEARVFGLYVLARDAGNAASHLSSPRDGEIFATPDALAHRAAALANDGALTGELLRAMGRPAPASTWADAAARFLAQAAMPQRRSARKVRPPRKLRAATRRPAASSRSRTAAHARGMSPRGTKVQ